MHYGQVMNIYQETLLPANGAFSITKRKYVIYRWRITLAPSYLNNQIEMETDLRIWEYNWYRMKEITKNTTKKKPLRKMKSRFWATIDLFVNLIVGETLNKEYGRKINQENKEFGKIAYHIYKELEKYYCDTKHITQKIHSQK